MVSHRVVQAAFVALAVLVLGASAAAQSAPSSSARAFGIRVVLPDGHGCVVGLRLGAAAQERDARRLELCGRRGGLRLDVDRASHRGGRGLDGGGSASVRSVSLFGGEVTVDGVFVKGSARASGDGADGDLSASSLSNLVVLGEPVRAGANARDSARGLGLRGHPRAAVVRSRGARLGYRGFVTGLHVVLTAAHGGLPAGTEIMVGYAEAAASAPEAEACAAAPAAPTTARPKEPLPPPSAPQVPPTVRPPPPDVEPKLTAAGYVFPIYGPASTSDSFGAPRTTTWHHGVDIFAPLGAPVLAVADGTLFNVGWNDVGGNRLWVRDGAGNEFYYAHLSAYSPLGEERAPSSRRAT